MARRQSCDTIFRETNSGPCEVLSSFGAGSMGEVYKADDAPLPEFCPAREATVASDASMSRRWLLVAPTLLFLWIIAQIDKTNVSLFIADANFLKELNLVGHNAELGGLMSTFFLGYGSLGLAWGQWTGSDPASHVPAVKVKVGRCLAPS